MRKVFLRQGNYLIEFGDSNIKTIRFNDSKAYRLFSLNVIDSIIFSINNEEVDLEKYGMIIYNPFQIDLNEKKFLNLVYKKLEKNIRDDERGFIADIEKASICLFEKLALASDFPIDYNDSFDISKFFSAFEVRIMEPEDYLEKIVRYIRLSCEIFHTKIFISFGLLALLDDFEIDLLNKELIQYDVSLLDVFYNEKSNFETLFIDTDWCII